MSILLVTGHWSLATLFVGVPLALSTLSEFTLFTLFVLAWGVCAFLVGILFGMAIGAGRQQRRSQRPVQTLFQTSTPPSKTDDDSYYG